jgi:hypothetical protein
MRRSRQTKLTRDSWREARVASSSQTHPSSQVPGDSCSDESDHDLGAIRLAPTLARKHRRISDSDDEDSGIECLGSGGLDQSLRLTSGPSAPSSPIPPKRTRIPSPRKKHRPDPDEEDAPDNETEDEDVDIELDEPDRFKTDSRLRAPKESKFLAGLKKLSSKRNGRSSPEVVDLEDEDEEGEEGVEEDDDGASNDSFISKDDEDTPFELPEEFALKRESPEFKFKVVFQYLVMLVVAGPGVLPLRGENAEYFGRQLRDMRQLVRGLRDSMAGTLWRPDFRKALETYPEWMQGDLDDIATYCDACNRRGQHCHNNAWLRGKPYDTETHVEEVEDSDDEDDSDPRDLGNMGALCLRRAQDFHELHHWEHSMFSWIRLRYTEMVRRKKGEDPGGPEPSLAPPKNADNVDEVTEWMDACGWQQESMRWLGRIEQRARRLEGHY